LSHLHSLHNPIFPGLFRSCERFDDSTNRLSALLSSITSLDFLSVTSWQISFVQSVFVLSRANWWKNLRGGAEVLLQLRGKAVKGFAEPVFDQPLIAEKSTQIVEMNAREARYFSVALDNRNVADPASVKLSAQHFIMIRIRLLAE
jgi:hypothetical protein